MELVAWTTQQVSRLDGIDVLEVKSSGFVVHAEIVLDIKVLPLMPCALILLPDLDPGEPRALVAGREVQTASMPSSGYYSFRSWLTEAGADLLVVLPVELLAFWGWSVSGSAVIWSRLPLEQYLAFMHFAQNLTPCRGHMMQVSSTLEMSESVILMLAQEFQGNSVLNQGCPCHGLRRGGKCKK